ncbi:hypothetical protein ACQEVC_38170 [Plantactinospora sp. CA-294935]|uniref:hypothetical protein n=1 Tax=Plantactinospora sp. CA-294935 TaxID=3240012 RepID=UPI003D8F8405
MAFDLPALPGLARPRNHLADADLGRLLTGLAAGAGVVPVLTAPPPGIEAVRRRHPQCW